MKPNTVEPALRYSRRFRSTAIVMMAVVPFLIFGAVKTMDSIHTSAIGWLGENDPGRTTYDRFTSRFEQGNAVSISWEGCRLGDRRIAQAEKDLSDTDKFIARVYSGESLFKMSTKKLQLSARRAKRRLRGSLLGPNDNTAVIVVLNDQGMLRRAEAVDQITEIVATATGVTHKDLILAGSIVDGVAIDRESRRSMDYFSAPSATLCFLICWACLRTMPHAIAILAVGGFGEFLALGSLYYLGITMDAVLVVLPPLIFVLTVSAGVHLANYFVDAKSSQSVLHPASLAVRNGWLPCSLAAVTTAIGVGSLVVSRITPISIFGVFAAVGVSVSLGLLLLVLPGVFVRWPGKRDTDCDHAARQPKPDWAESFARVLCRSALLIALLGMVALAVGVQGVMHLRTSISVHHLFAADSKTVHDFSWMEENIGPMIPLDIVVHFPTSSDLRPIDRLLFVTRVERAINSMDEIGGSFSVAKLFPNVPMGRKIGEVGERGALNSRLTNHFDEFINANFVDENEQSQAWRISARVSGLGEVDYENVLERVDEKIQALILESREVYPNITTEVTGVMPLVHRAQRTLLDDMFNSMMTAFALVWIIMILLLTDLSTLKNRFSFFSFLTELGRGIWLGTIAMLPNAFPIIVVFGSMGLLDLPIDIGSMMTACVALGIAVDDTIHFLTWYRKETSLGTPTQDALARCFRHCGKAMVQTTLICGLGLLIFVLSGFLPTRRFALLMFILLNSALVADLIFLPAILACPLGRPLSQKS